mgnify:CR=1 FL=1
MTTTNPSHNPDPDGIEQMFAAVAPRYDLLNTLLSLGRHRHWRTVAASLASPAPGSVAIDVCTGTGDLARELGARVGAEGMVLGLDFCSEMVQVAAMKNRSESVRYVVADAHRLPCPTGLADCAMIAFGIRNVQDPQRVLAEMVRILKVGGRLVCLEFGLPRDPVRRGLVRGYERTVIPLLGGAFGRRDAYRYLSSSIAAFAGPEELRTMMSRAGLERIETRTMSLGSVYAHLGVKR